MLALRPHGKSTLRVTNILIPAGSGKVNNVGVVRGNGIQLVTGEGLIN